MSNLFWLIEIQMARLCPFSPRALVARVLMTCVCFAALSLSIAMACDGAIRQENMERPRHVTIAGNVGAITGSAPGSWLAWLPRAQILACGQITRIIICRETVTF